jgi:3-demethylubiquinone-9 3-methyltransferase
MSVKQKITTFLWFDKEAEEAAKHYTSIFKNSRILSVARYGDAGPGPKGSVMTVSFECDAQDEEDRHRGPGTGRRRALEIEPGAPGQTVVARSGAGAGTAGAAGGFSSSRRTSCQSETRR